MAQKAAAQRLRPWELLFLNGEESKELKKFWEGWKEFKPCLEAFQETQNAAPQPGRVRANCPGAAALPRAQSFRQSFKCSLQVPDDGWKTGEVKPQHISLEPGEDPTCPGTG